MSVEVKEKFNPMVSEEWSVIDDSTVEKEIPFFGDKPVEENAEAVTGDEQETDAQREERELAESTLSPEELAAKRVAEAGTGKTAAEIKAEEDAVALQETERVKNELIAAEKAKWLKELGFDNEDEIKTLKNPAKPETEEEKLRKAELFEAEFHAWSVKENKLTAKEIQGYKTMSSLPVEQLVFADFAHFYKSENKDRKDENDEADPVTDEEIKEAFASVFHTDSENKILKAAGEKSLKARANEILADTKGKYEDTQAGYQSLMAKKAAIPAFKGFIREAIKAAIPEKFTYTVDGREFSVELDGTDLEKIDKEFVDQLIFDKYYDGADRQGLKAKVTEGADKLVTKKYMQKIAEEANRSGYSAGLAAKVIGARAPFEAPGLTVQKNAASTGKLTPAEREANKRGLR